ncbi:hypothetical protein [Verminephrobacter eiseniae]|uniref:hypothetical protein n=1 Tax=Verminephrobacter eiseniae TaxID=364317 RepID=UPI00031C462F|nr:hypothetical protein [Verminephrobacter eiseniae]
MADGRQLGRWALGCWQTEPDDDSADDGLVRGHSLFDGQPTWVRPVVEPQRPSAARPPEGAHTAAEGAGTPLSAARPPEGAHTVAEGAGTPASVVYHVGRSPNALTARIRATVQPVHTPGTLHADGAPRPDGASCRISLHAERPGDMDDARWLRLVRCHEVEVLLIQAQLRLLQAAQPPATPVCNPCGEAR